MPADPEIKIQLLRTNQGLDRNRLERICEYGQQALADATKITAFTVRCAEAKSYYDKFNNENLQLMQLLIKDPTGLELIRDSALEVDDIYFQIKGIEQDLGTLSGPRAVVPPNSTTSHVKLPRIELPTFSGHLGNWPSYIQLFRSLVDNNPQLTDIERHQYLLSSLRDEPLGVVRKLPLAEGNYTIALNSLLKRYDNKRALATFYWDAINNAPSPTTDSVLGLRNLVDTFSENMAALQLLGFLVEHWDFILLNLLLRKLDATTRSRFELEFSTTEIPQYSDLENFVFSQAKALEASSFNTNISTNSRQINVHSNPKAKHHAFMAKFEDTTTCSICKSNHLTYKCQKLTNLSPFERYSLIKSKGLCLNCLHGKHVTRDCKSKSSCRICNARHHSLLHFEKTPRDSPSPSLQNQGPSQTSLSNNAPAQIGDPSTSRFVANLSSSQASVLLATALIQIRNSSGSFCSVRALIDPGSQINLVSDRCCQQLGLRKVNNNLNIVGLNFSHSASRGWTSCTWRSSNPEDHFTLNSDFAVISKICSSMRTCPLSLDNLGHLKNICLADPTFFQPGEIDVLLGAEVYTQILLNGILRGTSDEPSALNTRLGWIILGKTTRASPAIAHSFHISFEETSLKELVQQFWELENVQSPTKLTPDEETCENIFVQAVHRNPVGRFIVPLPFAHGPPSFDASREIAVRRFYSLERRLYQSPELAISYKNFMVDYVNQGHMMLAEPPLPGNNNYYYIPHHCVVNPNSVSTKLRVVFDASTRDRANRSLNDTLLAGPKLQQDIVSLLINFRLHPIVLIADIKQMYRQILVEVNHCDYQRIVWRFNKEDQLRDYILLTVTYGVSSAPYLALRTIFQLANLYSEKWPLAAAVLKRDMYVDDVVTGCPSLEVALELKQQLIDIFAAAGFQLHKWASNHTELVAGKEEPLSFDGDNVALKVLGLKWAPNADYFFYHITPLPKSCTKRIILSELARIFDPLGFLTPLTFLVKTVLQHCWSIGLDWDAETPTDVAEKWSLIKSQLYHLHDVSIQRCAVFGDPSSAQLLGFCDASQKGYGAVIYLRCVAPQEIKVSLLCAKSKVAPLKRVSLPRLELCAAELLAKLFRVVLQSIPFAIPAERISAWSDSTVTSAWIQSPSYRWKTFVATRVSKIQEIVAPNRWFHIPTKSNPADCASRGLLPAELCEHPLWWAGPSFLKKEESSWPRVQQIGAHQPEAIKIEETTAVLYVRLDASLLTYFIDKFSSLRTILHILSYVIRFARFARNPGTRVTTSITQAELQNALMQLVGWTQQEAFGVEIKAIKAHRSLPKELRKLNPFLDEVGILRVGGRLVHSNLPFDQKHPALLPGSHLVTHLIIDKYHREYLHPGIQTLHYLLLQQFWILGAKRVIRNRVSKCLSCFKLNPKTYQPPMGNLPPLRISQLKPFDCVGVDFGGPFHITLGKARGTKSQKAYICLFVCYATKALHLELVSDLSSEAFLAALRRFIGRRGRCSRIFSDCGTNFVGASRQLAKWMQEAVEYEKIVWSFNPPSAPHFGGLWEAGIKSTKTHLHRVIGEQILTYEELSTVLIQIEALLNSRPLCALSSDPNDLQVLTPGHFLTLAPLSHVPEPNLMDVPLNRLSRWQLLQRLQQDFWSRWHKEYLHTLQQRKKWSYSSDSKISKGLLVLIKNELTSPMSWPLGRIIDVHPGTDGIIRVATVQTSTTTYKRPVVKLCPLPLH